MPHRALAPAPARGPRSRLFLPPGTMAGLAVAVLAIALIAVFTYQSLRSRESAVVRFTTAMTILEQLEALHSSLKDAETGQRGFLLTGADQYLEPYTKARAALSAQFASVRREVAGGTAGQQRRLDALERLSNELVQEMDETIELRRAGDAAAALAVVRTDRGKARMDQIHDVIEEIKEEERGQLRAREREWQEAVTLSSRVTWGGSLLLLVLVVAASFLMSRDYHVLETQVWLRQGQMGLSAKVQGEQRIESLGENVLQFLAEYLGAQVGAAYVEEDGRLRRFAGYAIPPGLDDAVLRPGDGLLGQAVKENRPLHVHDVPDGYLPVGSALGLGNPSELLVVPASADGHVQGVIELGFFSRVGPEALQLLARVSETLGIALRSSKDRSRLEDLLEETQRQAEELQTQQEELRVSNEELVEQGHALREIQSRMEVQQVELEQTNAQLEEQTQFLEHQKAYLSRAQATLTEKAEALERANQYKSEFLANMSHELRTPLNSSLILAKLLADNKDGNLTDEQVTYARTITSAGNDLLTIINDILDLAKIEAGKIDVTVAPVGIAAIVDDLAKSFQADADDKGLGFNAFVEPGTPDRIETDAQRLGQILKNLLSNAFKFTERGSVTLRVFPANDMISFAVCDTGIGIGSDQQQVVFEAFRQADGSTHRKHGGTGLGLSISRDLARLLGGEIVLHSTPGEGSVFTLTLPRAYSTTADGARRLAEAPRVEPPVTARAAIDRAAGAVPSRSVLSPIKMDDDRERLSPDARLILVVEDDERFAAILRDLAHEMGFQCVVTHSADDGLAAASLHRPSAILLDINLPDHSGLGVLDQLKRNPQTRHILVHVVSVADYAQQALERGAIGYALKPVKREQLVDAFRQLEAKLSQSLRRVLVVEDDERQRESIRDLLESGDVEITAVERAADALVHLAGTTFDCVVMDLSLPEMSGFELLQKMAEQENISFPPVIVYTGRSLTRDEEQHLRRFSKSIIIKDARSPERLLDEVTLFLHQVESQLPPDRQRMLKAARDRDATLEGRRILVVEDDVRNIFALSSVLEPKGASVEIARNGREALDVLGRLGSDPATAIDLVLMDIMMPEMDGLTAMREIRTRPQWKKLPIIALTAKAMRDDQEKCLAAGANDYIAKPLDVEKLLSLVRVWMPKS